MSKHKTKNANKVIRQWKAKHPGFTLGHKSVSMKTRKWKAQEDRCRPQFKAKSQGQREIAIITSRWLGQG